MVFKTGRMAFFLGAVILFCVGFRSFPGGNNWNLNKSAAATSKIFVVYPEASRTMENDLPAGDPAAGTATVTVATLMTSIFSDFNDIASSFIVLADQNDSDFAAQSSNRIIRLEIANPNGGSSGEASQAWSGGKVSGCTIKIRDSYFNSAKDFVALATHEIGHCLGLDHPQDITRSVMSYFRDRNVVRLQADDMMGMTFLYPVTDSRAQESPTFGASCARK